MRVQPRFKRLLQSYITGQTKQTNKTNTHAVSFALSEQNKTNTHIRARAVSSLPTQIATNSCCFFFFFCFAQDGNARGIPL